MNPHLHNPHLDGSSFFCAGGATGVLLLHGLTATTVEVRAFGNALNQAGFTVSGPLLPGHGMTPAALNATRWQDWVETAVAEYHHLATICDHVFVGGESTGAVIALYLASLYPDIAGVLAYAPAIALQISPVDVVKMRLAAPFVESMPKGSIDVSEKWQGYPVNPLKAGIELLKLERVVQRLLPTIHQPIFIVQGQHDTTIHPESGRIILEGAASQKTQLHFMANSSHVVLIDQEMDEILQRTLAFVDEILSN